MRTNNFWRFATIFFLSLTAISVCGETVEEMPRFPGGDQALMEFIENNLHCPKKMLRIGANGRVIVSFVVEKDGSITEPKVVKTTLKYKSGKPYENTRIIKKCEEEALRIVKMMPRWIPGKQCGVPVRVKYHVPFKFNQPKPKYPEEERKLQKFLENTFKTPQKVAEAGINGEIQASIIVRKDGTLDLKTLETENRLYGYRFNELQQKPDTSGVCKDPEMFELCNREVLRVCKMMPKWISGKVNGKPVEAEARFTVKVPMPKPQFSGGNEALNEFLKKNLRCPEEAIRDSVFGEITVSFIVGKDGTPNRVKMENFYIIGSDNLNLDGRAEDIPVFNLCEQETRRILGMMPKWIPAQVNGKPVEAEARFTLHFNHLDPRTANIRKMRQVLFWS